MTIATEIDSMIRLLQKNEEVRAGEHLAKVNDSGRIVEGLIARFSATRRYAYDPLNSIEIGPLKVSVKNFRADQMVEVPVRMELGIDDASQIFISLAEDPERSVHSSIRGWIKRSIDEELNSERNDWSNVKEFDGSLAIADNASRFEDAIVRTLEQKGFSARVVVELRRPGKLRLQPGRTESRLNDSNTEVWIKPDLDIEYVQQGESVAPRTASAWEDKFEKIAKGCMENHVSMEEYYRSKDFDALFESKLKPYFDKYGWRLTRFKCTREKYDIEKVIENIDVDWKSIDDNEVSIRFRVGLDQRPDGLPAYEDAGRPDLRAWLKKHVHKFTNDLLLKRDIGALAPGNIDAFRTDLGAALSEAAALIGMQVEFLVAEPDISEWKFLAERTFNIEKCTCETLQSGEPIDLQVDLIGKFATVQEMLDVIPNKKRSTADIEGLVKDRACEAIRKVMRGETLSAYLENFYHENIDSKNELERPFGKEIHDAIEKINKRIKDEVKSALGEISFLCSDLSVRPNEQKLHEALTSIDKCTMRAIRVTARPTDGEGDIYDIPFDLAIRVERPKSRGYPILLRKGFNPDEIDRALAQISRSLLSSMERHDLESITLDSELQLRSKLQKKFDEEVANFGVSVSISSINSEESKFKQAVNRRVEDQEIGEIDHNIERVGVERDEEVKALRKRYERRDRISEAVTENFLHALKSGSRHEINDAKKLLLGLADDALTAIGDGRSEKERDKDKGSPSDNEKPDD